MSVVPEAAVDPQRDSLSVVKLKKNLTLESGIVYRRDRKLSHTALAFLELARQFFHSSALRAAADGPTRN